MVGEIMKAVFDDYNKHLQRTTGKPMERPFIFHIHRGENKHGKIVDTLVILKDGEWYKVGVAKLSDKDRWNRKLGNKIALGRTASSCSFRGVENAVEIGLLELNLPSYVGIIGKLGLGDTTVTVTSLRDEIVTRYRKFRGVAT